MKTIKLCKLLDFNACNDGIESYCAHLGMSAVKTKGDLANLPDEVLDAERALVDYLSADTLYDVIWSIRCLDDWRTVATEFAQGCARSASAADAANADRAADWAAARAADAAAWADAAAARAASTAANAADATAYLYAAARSAAAAAWAAARAAARAAAAWADAAARAAAARAAAARAAAAGYPAAYAERARQVEHLRELLS